MGALLLGAMLALRATPGYPQPPVPAAPAAPAPDASAPSAPAGAEIAPDLASAEGFPVVVLNRTITTFRTFAAGYAPRERAAMVAARILEALKRGGPGEVKAVKGVEGRLVTIDGRGMFIISPADTIAPGSEEELERATREAVAALEQVVAEYREARDQRLMLWAGGKLLAATALLAGALWGLIAFHRWLRLRLSDAIGRHAKRLKVGGVSALDPAYLLMFARRLHAVVFWLVVGLLVYLWAANSLALFPYTRPWGEQLAGMLMDLLGRVGLAILLAVPGLAVVVLIALLTRFAVHVTDSFFHRIEAGEAQVTWLDPSTAATTRKLVAVALWVFAFVMAYPYLPGSDSQAFKGVSVLIGVMISIGGSSIVGQVVAGLLIVYSRVLRPGDYIRVEDTEGTVTRLGMFNVSVDTGMGEEIHVPNAVVIARTTRNFSRRQRGRGFVLSTAVTIGYDVPWRQVQAMLVEAARRIPEVLPEPAPRVLQTALSDFYVEYRLVCDATALAPEDRAALHHRLRATIQDVFNEYGVQIMSPHYLMQPETRHVVPPSRWYEAPAKPPEPGGR